MGKHICSDADVQFLDDTVANISMALARDKPGRRVLRRTYRFEFSETGNTRLEGSLNLAWRQDRVGDDGSLSNIALNR